VQNRLAGAAEESRSAITQIEKSSQANAEVVGDVLNKINNLQTPGRRDDYSYRGDHQRNKIVPLKQH